MKLFVSAIYDAAVGSYQMPYYSRSKGEAVRIFCDAVNDKNSPFNKHSHDFTLCQVGIFDDQSGIFDNIYNKIMTANEALFLETTETAVA